MGINVAHELRTPIQYSEEKHPKIPGHHTSAYKKGWMTAYTDVTREASNDNGTYGNKCKKYH